MRARDDAGCARMALRVDDGTRSNARAGGDLGNRGGARGDVDIERDVRDAGEG